MHGVRILMTRRRLPDTAFVLWLLLLSVHLHAPRASVVVAPDFRPTMLYVYPAQVTATSTVAEMKEKRFVRHHKRACLTDTAKAGHSVNRVSEVTDHLFKGLKGTTLWVNEWMQVGHAPFDSALIQVLRSTHVDRIVLQRAACTARLCDGIGNFRSFFAAYYAAALAGARNPDMPIYMRLDKNDMSVKATYVSVHTPGYINTTTAAAPDSISLHEHTCFDEVILRGPYHHGNFYGSKSPEAVQAFKAAAYGAASVRAINGGKPLPTSFPSAAGGPGPIAVLVSYRGQTHRHIENYPALVAALTAAFPPSSNVALTTMNNGNSSLTAEMQLKAVADAHVVVTNHGAFEGNLVYMRNASMLVELVGNYENEDFVLFQNYSREFGVFYARLQGVHLKDHNQPAYNLTDAEIQEVVTVVQQYVTAKPFLKYNVGP